jgi:hypothetical protein
MRPFSPATCASQQPDQTAALLVHPHRTADLHWPTRARSGNLSCVNDRNASPFTVSLTGADGAVITLGPALPRIVDAYEFVDFWMSIDAEGLSVKTVVRTIEGGTGPYCLTQFVQEVADDWRGEAPDREFESIEHDLSIAVTHDALGHVLMRVTLRDSYRPDSWEVRVAAKVDAGEDMSRFAGGVRQLLESA